MGLPINSLSSFIVKEIIKFIKASYAKRPALTVIGIIGFITAVLTLIYISESLQKERNSNLIVTNEQLIDKVNQINKIQIGIKELDNFLEDQERSITNQQRLLEKLKKEKNELQPIVEANREVINRIFEEQDRKSKYDMWIGLGLGFLFGIPASFLASIIHDFYKKKRKLISEEKVVSKAENDNTV